MLGLGIRVGSGLVRSNRACRGEREMHERARGPNNHNCMREQGAHIKEETRACLEKSTIPAGGGMDWRQLIGDRGRVVSWGLG